MILSCNSCEKKFVVPDRAITAAGRVVQCGSCGNKWKQFPVKNKSKTADPNIKINNQKTVKSFKPKKKNTKKTREIDLYSPEYLAKKHGINLYENKKNIKSVSNNKGDKKDSFGFYNYLIVLIASLTFVVGVFVNTEQLIINKFPASEIYINHLYETLSNIKVIINNLLKSN